MKLSRNALVVGVVLALVLIGGTTWVFAQGDGFDIHACVNPSGGIRIVDDADSCRPLETLLEWNIMGPQGPPGEKGDPGEPGLLTVYYPDSTVCLDGPGGGDLVAACDPGDPVLGGGYTAGCGVGWQVHKTHPVWPDFESWNVSYIYSGSDYDCITVYAVCADVAP